MPASASRELPATPVRLYWTIFSLKSALRMAFSPNGGFFKERTRHWTGGLNTAGILFTGKAGKWPGARSVAAYVTKPGHAA